MNTLHKPSLSRLGLFTLLAFILGLVLGFIAGIVTIMVVIAMTSIA